MPLLQAASVGKMQENDGVTSGEGFAITQRLVGREVKCDGPRESVTCCDSCPCSQARVILSR